MNNSLFIWQQTPMATVLSIATKVSGRGDEQKLLALGWTMYFESGEEIAFANFNVTDQIGIKLDTRSLTIAAISTVHAIRYADTIVVHGAERQIKVLNETFSRIGINILKEYISKVICTQYIGTDICKIPKPFGGNKWPSLSELYTFLFSRQYIRTEAPALNDARVTAQCYFKIRQTIGTLNK